MKLEQLDFETETKFREAFDNFLNGRESFREYADKEGQVKRTKIVSKNRLYLCGNYSLSCFKADSGKIYFSLEYLGVEDRIKIAQNKK